MSLGVNPLPATLKSLSTGADRDGMLKNSLTIEIFDNSIINFIKDLEYL